MPDTVFLAVLGAALLHAAWNALLKSAPDKSIAMMGVVLGHLPLAVVSLVLVPTPALDSLPYLGASVLLHVGYQVFLLNSYRIGDLTLVYPIARGSAPLLVALISVAVLGVTLGAAQIAAIVVIAAGILSVGIGHRGIRSQNPRAALLALVTGCFIAGYSLVDGLGTRAAGTALGFWGWQAIANAACMILYISRAAPGALRYVPTLGRTAFLVGGSASFAAYAIVLWAFARAPIALVTALRETSIVFALLIGALVLGERIDRRRTLSALTILSGVLLLRLASP